MCYIKCAKYATYPSDIAHVVKAIYYAEFAIKIPMGLESDTRL